MPAFLQSFLPNILAIISIGTLLWLLSLKLKDASIIDFFWGPGFVISVVISGSPFLLSFPQLFLLMIIILWGIRLGLHMFSKHQVHGEEDIRYQRMRAKFAPGYWWKSGLIIFALQSVLLLVIAYPYHTALAARDTILGGVFGNTIIILGIVLSLFGFTYEVIADTQLKKFKAEKHNKSDVLQTGLWKFSRHPNYLGEIILSWGLGLICFSQVGVLGFLSPIIITFILLKVSGVPMAEQTMLESRGEAYKQYQNDVPAVFPKLLP